MAPTVINLTGGKNFLHFNFLHNFFFQAGTYFGITRAIYQICKLNFKKIQIFMQHGYEINNQEVDSFHNLTWLTVKHPSSHQDIDDWCHNSTHKLYGRNFFSRNSVWNIEITEPLNIVINIILLFKKVIKLKHQELHLCKTIWRDKQTVSWL